MTCVVTKVTKGGGGEREGGVGTSIFHVGKRDFALRRFFVLFGRGRGDATTFLFPDFFE